MTIIGTLLLIAIGLAGLFVIAIWITGKPYDNWAIKSAKKYCKENNLEYIEAKAFPNHYGLYFRKGRQQFYASYDFERTRTITWKKESPLQKIEQRRKNQQQHHV
jgi:hypothetical protein